MQAVVSGPSSGRKSSSLDSLGMANYNDVIEMGPNEEDFGPVRVLVDPGEIALYLDSMSRIPRLMTTRNVPKIHDVVRAPEEIRNYGNPRATDTQLPEQRQKVVSHGAYRRTNRHDETAQVNVFVWPIPVQALTIRFLPFAS